MVTAIGDGVTSVAVGDHVVVTAMPQCGACYRCPRGQPSLCEVGDGVLFSGALRDGTPRFATADGSAGGPDGGGRHVRRGGRRVGHLGGADPRRRPVRGRRRCSAAGSSPGSGRRSTPPPSGPAARCAVIGCGSVGLAAVQGARLAGAERDHRRRPGAGQARSGPGGGRHHGAAGRRGRRRRRTGQEADRRAGRRRDASSASGPRPPSNQAIAMTGKGGEVVFVGAGDAATPGSTSRSSGGSSGRAKTFKGRAVRVGRHPARRHPHRRRLPGRHLRARPRW